MVVLSPKAGIQSNRGFDDMTSNVFQTTPLAKDSFNLSDINRLMSEPQRVITLMSVYIPIYIQHCTLNMYMNTRTQITFVSIR